MSSAVALDWWSEKALACPRGGSSSGGSEFLCFAQNSPVIFLVVDVVRRTGRESARAAALENVRCDVASDYPESGTAVICWGVLVSTILLRTSRPARHGSFASDVIDAALCTAVSTSRWLLQAHGSCP